jgi:hypothetical protein
LKLEECGMLKQQILEFESKKAKECQKEKYQFEQENLSFKSYLTRIQYELDEYKKR